MAQVEKSVLVPYSAQQMYDLVDGVENYPQFLPWCGGTDLKWRDETTTLATITIDYHGIRQSFTTENTNQIPALIQIRLQDGPFRRLEGSWHFIALNENACKIEFHLHYEFSSKLLESLFGPVFNHITNNFVDAFVQRAEKVYGS
ncbi:MAG: type II toxin-antitoxin system RatA family toxin [Sulfuricella sp.]|jgi:ribosome-associated toxin RatA of RatAB toxin-antitoxin module|nr:type II toxin-antitoxin system RatA family toxin [Sulfuricella sp.]